MTEPINGTQAFLIECNRGNSVIDSTAPDSNNAAWTTKSDFSFRRGDRVSVEAVMIESSGAGSQAQTIEFSGENVRVGDREQNWTDDTIILEFGFYVSNNGDRTINLPTNFKHNVNGNAGTALKINSGLWTAGQPVGTPTAVASQRQYPGCSAAGSEPGFNFQVAGGAQTAYGIFNFEDNGGGFSGGAVAGTPYRGIVLNKAGDPGPGLNVEYPAETFPYPAGANMNGRNTAIVQGMCVYIQGDSAGVAFPTQEIGAIEYVSTDTLGGSRLYIRFVDEWTPAQDIDVNTGLIAVSAFQGDLNLDNRPDSRYGYSANPANFDFPNSVYKRGARIGIGLYNSSSPFTAPGVAPTQATASQGMDVTKARLNGGAFLWEQTRVFSAVTAAQIPELGCSTTTTTGSNGAREMTTMDLKNYKDNQPYILISPEYSGPQPTPNGLGMSPELYPMTAYVIIKAENSFEDVNNLARAFTSAFHSINPLLTGQGNKLQDYINNAVFPFNKANNVYPLTSRGYFSEVEGTGQPNYTDTTAALWNKVSPLWIGNLMKCIPSNIINQPNWKYQVGSPFFYHPQQTTDYLKVGDEGDWQWNNFIYGNMGVRNYRKCYAGDRFIRCSCWDGNTTTHPNRDIPRPIILNTQLRQENLNAPAPPTAASADFLFDATQINQWETIFTNIEYEIPAYPSQTNKYANLDRIQECFRFNEKYQVTNPEALNGYENQNAQSWWTWESDIGMSNGNIRMNKLNSTLGLLTPVQTNWLQEFPADATAPTPLPSAAPLTGSITSPANSFPGQGGEVNTQSARDSGRCQVYSRWFNEWEGSTNPNVPDGAPLNPVENPINQQIGQPFSFCQIRDLAGDYLYPGGVKESKSRNIGVVPYLYNDETGATHWLCAFVVAKTYKATNGAVVVDPDTGLQDTAAGTSSWQLSQFYWGDFFGWSPNFGYDQPSVLPMNPDYVQDPLEVNSKKPAEKWAWNNQNYSWVGANDALMTFDNEKNRFSLSGLYTATTLSAINSDTPGADSPQLGQVMATLNTNQKGAINYLTDPTNEPLMYNKTNQAVQDSITGVFLNNVYFAPKGWTPPTSINPQNIYNPYVGKKGQNGVDAVTYRNDTTANREEFLKDLTVATQNNWSGNLMDKMGFDFTQLMPHYGEQDNRYSNFTYGRENIEFMNEGKRPLMMNGETDVADNLYVNIYTSPPPPPPVADNGTPLYQNGLLNNNPVNLGNINSVILTANRIPTLFACPFYLVISDICPTQFQSGAQKQDCIFYGLKNYGAGQYFYIFGSSYSQLIDTDRTITSISTEIRNPLTGRLARLSKNSCIIYKIERDISLPGITIDAVGQPIQEEVAPIKTDPMVSMESELKKLIEGEVAEKTLLSTLIKNESKQDKKVNIDSRDMISQLKKQLAKHQEPIKVLINNRDNRDFGLESKSQTPTINMRDLQKDLIKLVIQKALVNFPISKTNLQNEVAINTGIKNALQKYADQMNDIMEKAGTGEVDLDGLISKIADSRFYLGVNGQVIRNKSGSAKELFAKQPLLDAMAESAMNDGGAGIRKLVKQGISNQDLNISSGSGEMTLKKLADDAVDVMKDYKRTKYLAKKTGVDEGTIIEAKQLAKRILKARPEMSDKGREQLLRSAEEMPAQFIRSEGDPSYSVAGSGYVPSREAMRSFNKEGEEALKTARVKRSESPPKLESDKELEV